MQHDVSGAFLLHAQDLRRSGEVARCVDGEKVHVPTSEERRIRKNCFVKCIWCFVGESVTLTSTAGCDVSCDVDEAGGPTMARALKLSNGLIPSVMTRAAAMTLTNEMDVLR